MADISYVFFSFNVSSMLHAYQIGQSALAEELRISQEEVSSFAAKVASGEEDEWVEDETTGEGYNHGEYLFFAEREHRENMNTHRKAFSIMFHHLWEKHVCRQMNYDIYQFKKAYGELEKRGWELDKRRLERLRLVANCVKHGGVKDDDVDLCRSHMDLFDTSRLPEDYLTEPPDRNWETALQLNDRDVTDFADTVLKSAYKKTGWGIRY